MGYNKANLNKKIALVQELVQKHYIEGVTTYKGIWRTYVTPVYPMSYETFIKYINTPLGITKPNEDTTDQLKLNL